MTGLVGAFIAEVVLVTYRQTTAGIKTPTDAPIPFPLPSTYTAAIILFGGLGLLPRSIAPIPALVGWGIVTATWLKLYEPGAANTAAAANASLGTALGGQPSSLATSVTGKAPTTK